MSISTSFSTNPENVILNYTITGFEKEIVQVTFADLDAYMKTSIRYGIIYGVGMGASLVLIFLLFIMIKNKKTPMFILNQLSLIFLVIKSSLYLSYLLGPLASLSFSFTGMLIPNTYYTYKVSVATNIMHSLMIACIQASLCYQVFVIFRYPKLKSLGIMLTAFFACISVTVFSLYLYSTAMVAKTYQALFSNSQETVRYGTWVNNLPFLLFSSSINIISLILFIKLAFAIRTRRYLGLKQFDSLHILLLMATQTMCIPSILVIINYKDSKSSNTILSTISIILIVISLPLSSMWASAANNSPIPSSSSISFLSKTSTNNSDSQTFVSSNYSFFPSKASKLNKTPDLENVTMNDDSPTTLNPLNSAEIKFNNGSHIDYYGNNDKDGYDIFEKANHIDLDDDEIGSIERDLSGVNDGDFKAVTAHSKN